MTAKLTQEKTNKIDMMLRANSTYKQIQKECSCGTRQVVRRRIALGLPVGRTAHTRAAVVRSREGDIKKPLPGVTLAESRKHAMLMEAEAAEAALDAELRRTLEALRDQVEENMRLRRILAGRPLVLGQHRDDSRPLACD